MDIVRLFINRILLVMTDIRGGEMVWVTELEGEDDP